MESGILIDSGFTLCPYCNKKIEANFYKVGEKIFLEKTCEEHGTMRALHPWEDHEIYSGIKQIFNGIVFQKNPAGLILNLTNSCNQSCPYCFQDSNNKVIDEPDIKKIEALLDKFQGKTIFLCGGEPTLRKDIFHLIEKIKRKKFKVCLFSNGKKLAEEPFVQKLEGSGTDLVIMQFDTLKDEKNVKLRGEPLLELKFKALENLKKAKLPVYLFTMLVKDINDDEIRDLHEFFLKREEIKILNFNPVWEMGRFQENRERLTNSGIVSLFEKNRVLSKKEFLENTEFTILLAEFRKLFTKNKFNIHPKCELRVYYFKLKGRYLPASEFLELAEINNRLRKDLGFMTKNSRLFFLPVLVGLLLILFFKIKRGFRFTLVKFIFSNLRLKNIFFKLEIKSLIIGTFHSHENNDLDFIESCNLFSDNPFNEEIESSCLRQMKVFGKENLK